jgi:cyclic pyranopterin phosphate synthase
MGKLTHIDRKVGAVMRDVSSKKITLRKAAASGRVLMKASTLRTILSLRVEKGDVVQVARLAGIMGAKRVPELIPLCHPIILDNVKVSVEPGADGSSLEIRSEVVSRGRTGVEMEALAAVAAAALTVYDMCKSLDRDMVIGEIMLQTKSGGKSGSYARNGGKSKP